MVEIDTPIPAGEPPEPDPFTAEEFGAWRGMLRVHSAVLRELDHQLLVEHGLGIDSYGVLVTLVSPPAHTMTIGELGQRRNLSPSGISRSVDRLAKLGLLERTIGIGCPQAANSTPRTAMSKPRYPTAPSNRQLGFNSDR